MLAVIVATIPLVLLLTPYALSHHLSDFVDGALILPQKRLAFATMSMASGWWMLDRRAGDRLCGSGMTTPRRVTSRLL